MSHRARFFFRNPNVGYFDEMMQFLNMKYTDLFNTTQQSQLRPLPGLPDLSSVSSAVPKNGFFSLFTPLHMDAVHEVREILLGTTLEIYDCIRRM